MKKNSGKINQEFNDTISKVAEMRFLEQAYMSRKFLIDKDVINESLPPAIKKIFFFEKVYKSYDWKEATRHFHTFASRYLSTYLFNDSAIEMLINIDIFNQNIWSNLVDNFTIPSNNIISAIEKYQNYFLYTLLKDSATDKLYLEYLKNNSLMMEDDPDFMTMMHQFFLISCKYGIYLANLIMPNEIGTLIENYYKYRGDNKKK